MNEMIERSSSWATSSVVGGRNYDDYMIIGVISLTHIVYSSTQDSLLVK